MEAEELGDQVRRHYYTDMCCPVCLQQAVIPVETNCGHLFCGPCLFAFWESRNSQGAIPCPICKQTVTSLSPLFRDHAANHGQVQAEPLITMRDLDNYNRRFAVRPRSLTGLLRNFSMFFSIHGLCWVSGIHVLLYLVWHVPLLTPEVMAFLDNFLIVLELFLRIVILSREAVERPLDNFDLFNWIAWFWTVWMWIMWILLTSHT